MIKRFTTALAALLLALTAALAGASPAQAAYSACNTNEFCLWADANGNGSGWARTYAQLRNCQSLVGSSVGNDNAESVRNRTGWHIEIWEHANCTGTRYVILPTGGATSGYNLGAFPNATSGVRAVLNYYYGSAHDYLPAGTVGMAGDIDINNPSLGTYDHHSIAQMSAQSTDGKQIVEIGWSKNPNLCVVTTSPCIFVSYWKDGVHGFYGGNGAGGSGNGFVDYGANTTTYAGLSLSNAAPGPRFQIEYQGTLGSGAWWLGYDNQWIGYYPDTLWDVADSFDEIGLGQWYGEVASNSDSPCADMGSGTLPPGAGAAKFQNIQIYDDVTWSNDSPTLDGQSYSSQYHTTTVTSNSFRFGGPGFC